MCLISKKQGIWDTSTPKPMPLPGERYPTTKNSRRSQVSSTSVVQSAHAQVLHPEHLEPYRTHPGAHSGAPVRSVGARYRRPLPCPSRTLLPYQDRCCGTARPVLACTTRPLHSRRMPTPRHTGTCSPRLAAPGCVAIRRRGWSHKSRWRQTLRVIEARRLVALEGGRCTLVPAASGPSGTRPRALCGVPHIGPAARSSCVSFPPFLHHDCRQRRARPSPATAAGSFGWANGRPTGLGAQRAALQSQQFCLAPARALNLLRHGCCMCSSTGSPTKHRRRYEHQRLPLPHPQLHFRKVQAPPALS